MRYALISFLNARPLWWGLTSSPRSDEEFSFASPARCADLIAEGSAHLALVPAIELIRNEDLVALPEICIASRTEVRSVLLVSRVPFDEIRSVALDPSSRTSVALARILLGERGRDLRQVRFDAVEHETLLTLEGHDAAVVIGDRALQLSRGENDRIRFRYDLVSEWNALFGEPFVFALWAGRRDVLEQQRVPVLDRLLESREIGLRNLDTIARRASDELALPYRELIDYFTRALHYDFGEGERHALARFHALATKYDLVEEPREIRWLTAPTSPKS